MGYHDVFVHVGDQVRIQAPNGKWVAPLVTGKYKLEFWHSGHCAMGPDFGVF
jgi:hypothetical protein